MYEQFCLGALKLDISTLLTTFFLWTSLQLILYNRDDNPWNQSILRMIEKHYWNEGHLPLGNIKIKRDNTFQWTC